MAFAQLTYRESLRDIESCLRALQSKLYHMGFRGKVSRSTLADANESHDWRIFAEFAQVLIGIARPLPAHDPIGVDLDQSLYALDSTTIDLCLSLFPWAKFRRRKAAVKMHTLLDLHGNIPTFIRVTSGDVHDVNILDEIMPEAGSFYVLTLSPKSRVHVRGLIHALWDYAMWRGDAPTQRNPMELVTIKGATKRMRKPRSLTVEEFQLFMEHLAEPIRTIALVCVCFGLRISECLALRWSDVDWLSSKLKVERGIVRQQVDDVKTIYSGKVMAIDAAMLEVLKTWRQNTQFSSDEDWIFASPVKLGRLPVSYPWVWLMFQQAASKAGIGKLGTHSLRHSYRSWLDAVGTPIAVQQKLMRHSDIRTTLNIYGDVVTDEMAQAHSKVVGLALPRKVIAN